MCKTKHVPSTRIKAKGFTLIEVLVALVILSSTFAAVWTWLNTSSITTQKIATRISLQESSVQFLDYLSLQPLNQQASGSFAIKDLVFEYKASIIRRSDREGLRRQPAWIVGLFDVQVLVYRDTNIVAEYQTQELRYWPDPNYIDLESQL